MAERELVLSALVREILGPRGGARETLRSDEDPVDEYIAGVLAPHRPGSVELDADDDLVGDQGFMPDDQMDPGPGVASPCFDPTALPSPALDPRSRPASLGLSFCLDGDGPAVDLCCSWARYRQVAGGGWERHPDVQVWEEISCTRGHQLTPASDAGIRVHVRSRWHEGRWRVSVFLVNVTSCEGRPGTEEHLFQPQIRVRCRPGTQVVSLDEGRGTSDDEDQQSLALQYRERRSFARGHLCSTTWSEIDPERAHPTLTSPSDVPFTWLDGQEVLGQPAASRFSPPDVRTEYVPVVPVNAPDKTWPADLHEPQFSPEWVSEAWDPTQMRTGLDPLAAGYETWIQVREADIAALGPDEQETARRHLHGCRAVLGRIRAGIDLLARDDDVRLAFCFANRAIAIQSRWTKGRVNSWWPFQLAFQLLNLPAIADRGHGDRSVCDLLWFPTGGGKTEAYLGLAAFTMAYRRLKALRDGEGHGGAGVAVLSRYTLRLLTIQQFRRALALITACEMLRVDRSSGARGWRPSACPDRAEDIWGGLRFSTGLWVGGAVTPNNLQDFTYRDRAGRLIPVHGALSTLEGRGAGEGEPAQVLTCPACSSHLAISPDGFQRGESVTLHFVLGDAARASTPPSEAEFSSPPFDVAYRQIDIHQDPQFCTLSIHFSLSDQAKPETVDAWFREHVRRAMGPETWLVAARASRPGYFLRSMRWGRSRSNKPIDFEIFCPNPSCDLNRDMAWSETRPTGPWPVIPAFLGAAGAMTRCPIPAWTVDEQIYQWCPSIVVATVDKFARLSFEPRAASLFGNVESYNEHLGYHRNWCPPLGPAALPSAPLQNPGSGRNMPVPPFAPPDLILQDELHLIEGPLGSMVGLYETAVDLLASAVHGDGWSRPKYIASTATVRNAASQVQSLYVRELAVFPPPGLSVDDTFFARTGRIHPLDADPPGRLYVGVCAPGRGAQTPIVRIWSRLLEHVAERRSAGIPDVDLDPFWTLVGYFNAIRELRGAVALTRQDIPQRLAAIGTPSRVLEEDEPLELRSGQDPMLLPALLGQLQASLGGATAPVNVVVATSMFGTGVDVDRLGLMVVHGQPKTTSAYIQATGRVGRSRGGLIVTFFRASRPRDLNHYEFFATYHNLLYSFVEPITVNPFAPRARDRALGPVAVALLRQAAWLEGAGGCIPVHDRWRVQQRIQRGIHCLAHEMATVRRNADVDAIPLLFEERSRAQPSSRRPLPMDTQDHSGSELDCWQQLAARTGGRLVYYESTLINLPQRPVVLGDLAHEVARTGVAYEDAPNSLRDVEPTITIRGWR